MHSSTLISEIFELTKNDKINELTQLLLQNKNSLSVLNQGNVKKETPLHISAYNLSFECLQLLLESGALPNLQDAEGRTPVLCILTKLKDCICDTCTRRAVKCINLLGEFNADMNIPDTHGEIPLHLAAQLQCDDCASSLLDNGAVVGTYNGIPMLAILLERIPTIILSVLDRSMEFGTQSIHEPNCEVIFDLGVILPDRVNTMRRHQNNAVKNISTDNGNSPGGNNSRTTTTATITTSYEPQQEMGFLSNLLEATDEDSKIYKAVLHHPLVNVFSDIKWKRLELLFYAFLLLQISVLIAYTIFLFLTIFNCPYDFVLNALKLKEEAHLRAKDAGGNLPSGNVETICEISTVTKIVSISLSIYVVFCTTIVIIKEVQHAIMDCREYFKDLLNYIQLVGLAAIAATIVIAWDPESKIYTTWLYPVAAFGMGISWFQIFIQIGRLPQLAIYVDMFAKIAINFCWSLCIYSLILIGFAMSYCVLFPDKPRLVDIPLAIIKVLTMMVGELDYEGLFPDSDAAHNSTSEAAGPFRHPVTAHLWYVIFVIMVTLVLMNLLVGLAVSDIHGCRKNAEIVVIKRRIRYIAYLENTFYLATNFVPKIMRDFLRKRISIVIPQGEMFNFWRRSSQVSDLSCIKVRPNDSNDNVLSNESKKSIKFWMMAKGKNNERRKCNYRKQATVVEDSNNQNVPWTSDDQATGTTTLKIELSIQRLERRLTELDTKLDKIFYKMSEKSLLSD